MALTPAIKKNSAVSLMAFEAFGILHDIALGKVPADPDRVEACRVLIQEARNSSFQWVDE